LEAGRIDGAVDEFLGILGSDPGTVHFNVIPIAWRASQPDAALEARAATWLASERSPVAIVLGASWLLPTSQRAAATASLNELASSKDPRIAGMAAIQLWRTKLVTAKADDPTRWEAQLEQMPAEIQAAGWYVLGEVLARQNRRRPWRISKCRSSSASSG
jgi:hypothetical protein